MSMPGRDGLGLARRADRRPGQRRAAPGDAHLVRSPTARGARRCRHRRLPDQADPRRRAAHDAAAPARPARAATGRARPTRSPSRPRPTGCSSSRTTRSTSWWPSACSRRSATPRRPPTTARWRWQEMRKGGYDAVLMDVQMPRMDGYAATRAIRAEQSVHVPVIAMTAAAVEGERERCLAAGMDDFLTKPVDPSALAAVLERWVGGSETTAARRTLRGVSGTVTAPPPPSTVSPRTGSTSSATSTRTTRPTSTARSATSCATPPARWRRSGRPSPTRTRRPSSRCRTSSPAAP